MQKCIFRKYKTFEEFWARARGSFLVATPRDVTDRINAWFYAYKCYEYWKFIPYLGSEETFFSRFISEMTTKFYEISKREKLYNQIFPQLHTWTQLVNIRTSELSNLLNYVDKTTKSLSSSQTDAGGGLGQDDNLTDDPYKKKSEWIRRNIDTKKGLVEIETIDDLKRKLVFLKAGLAKLNSRAYGDVDLVTREAIETQISQKTSQLHELQNKIEYWNNNGITSQQTLSPNWVHEKGIANKHASEKIINTQQQRSQQISNVLQTFGSLEVGFTDSINSFSHFFNPFVAFSGRIITPGIGGSEFRYIKSNANRLFTLQEQVNVRLNCEDISEEYYEELKRKGKILEKTWYLECLVRHKRRLEKQVNQDLSPASEENINRCIEACDKLLNSFSEDIRWPSLQHYDQVMSSVVGFDEFKRELRVRIEISDHYKKIGARLPQVFYCLIGKPGVGKTEICRVLARALQKPIEIIGVAGLTDSAILNGRDRSYKSSRWGKVMDAFVTRKAQMTVELKDLQEDFYELRNKYYRTELEQKRLKDLHQLIQSFQEQGYARRELKKFSKAPIILLDEFDKAKDETIRFLIGQITDRDLNYDFYDKFFELNLDLSDALIFLTANYAEKIPDFLTSRCKIINVPVLTYAERLQILENKKIEFIKEYFPASKGDRIVFDGLTNGQLIIARKITTNFLKECITEEWGVRGSIMNLISVFDFMILLNVRQILQELVSLEDYDVNKKQITLNSKKFHYNIGGTAYILTLERKKDVSEVLSGEGQRPKRIETVRNILSGWPNIEGESLSNNESLNNNQQTTTKNMHDLEFIIRERDAEINRLNKELGLHNNNIPLVNQKQTELQQEIEDLKAENRELRSRISEMNKFYIRMYLMDGNFKDSKVVIDGAGLGGKSQALYSSGEHSNKVRDLTIENFEHLIQIDLTHLTNLEKLTLRNNSWDNIKGARGCTRLKIVIIENCKNISLDWLSGTNVEQCLIDDYSLAKENYK